MNKTKTRKTSPAFYREETRSREEIRNRKEMLREADEVRSVKKTAEWSPEQLTRIWQRTAG